MFVPPQGGTESKCVASGIGHQGPVLQPQISHTHQRAGSCGALWRGSPLSSTERGSPPAAAHT
eukprot:363663-Chlamydomonas_euryale.AAC.5